MAIQWKQGKWTCKDCSKEITQIPQHVKDEDARCPECHKKTQRGKSNKNEQKSKRLLCPICKKEEIPSGREACLTCVPKARITCKPIEESGCWKLVFQTYPQLGKQEGMDFFFGIAGDKFKQVKLDQKQYLDFKKRGVLVITVPFVNKEVRVEFGLLGVDADAEEPVVLPSRRAPKKEVNLSGPGPDLNQGLRENFMAGMQAGKGEIS